MNEKEVIEKAIEYVNLFGYIQWHELRSIEFNNESSNWKVVFSAKQNETDEIIAYKLEVNSLSGNIANLQMMED